MRGFFYLKEEDTLTNMCEVFDLYAIAIYTDYGKEIVCNTSNYDNKLPEILIGLYEEPYLALFGEEGVYVESNLLRLNAKNPAAYQEMKSRGIGATIKCIGKKDGKPYSWMAFDIIESRRKWSDNDIEMLSILGKCCCNILCNGNEKTSN